MRPGRIPRRSTPLSRAAASTPHLSAKDTPKAAPVYLPAGVPARRRVNPVSAKRAVQRRQYAKLRAAFLAGASCARCASTLALTVQHLRGRVGADYLDTCLWLPLCWSCHQWVGDHPRAAMDAGWALPRIRGRAA